jgi:hypothetical protein
MNSLPRGPMKRRSGPRKTANLSDSIHHQLNMYALAASAAGVGMLALAQPAEARIVYTPDHRKLTTGNLYVDLNHDGAPDFSLSMKGLYWSRKCTYCGQYLSVDGYPNPGAAVMGMDIEASALRKGRLIGSRDTFVVYRSRGLQMAAGWDEKLSSKRFFAVSGQFANKMDRFLGVRFEIRGKYHYGWIRFANVTVTFKNGLTPVVRAVLDGYAYETIPGKSIKAGQTKEAADDFTSENFGPDASLTNPIPNTPQPAALGLLALGSPGLSIWRRKESALLRDRAA